MAREICIMDFRSGFDVRGFPGVIIPVWDSDAIEDVIATVVRTAEARGDKKISRLVVLAHGYEQPAYGNPIWVCQDDRGGYGVQIGKDDLSLANTGVFAPLQGRFVNGGLIEFHACRMADVSPDSLDANSQAISGNGHRLCAEIAAYANTPVKAGSQVQYLEVSKERNWRGVPKEIIQWHENWWVPPVFVFSPTTGAAKRVL